MNNKHRYNNQTSRWCDANAVPYQRNGFLFGPKEIQDQITNQTMYHVDLTNTEAKASELFEKDDWVIAQYAQGYIRCQISDFSPRAGNLIVDRYYNDQFINVVPEKPIWYIDSEIENIRTGSIYSSNWIGHGVNPVEKAKSEGWILKNWQFYAVPKKVIFKLNLLGEKT